MSGIIILTYNTINELGSYKDVLGSTYKNWGFFKIYSNYY